LGLIYIDSCILIYAVDRHPVFGAPARAALHGAAPTRFATSALVKAECLVRPFRLRDYAAEQAFMVAFSQMADLPMTEITFIAAARLRATHSLKLADALHLACAQAQGCSALWTNDDRLAAAAPGFARAIV
jgi:uncharacterized protein